MFGLIKKIFIGLLTGLVNLVMDLIVQSVCR